MAACVIDHCAGADRNHRGHGPLVWAQTFVNAIDVAVYVPRPRKGGLRHEKVLVGRRCLALTAALGASAASAQGKSGGQGGGRSSFVTAPGSERGLDRADAVAGKHGAKGRANARTRGANAKAFCPPGQAKKDGKGSRFAC